MLWLLSIMLFWQYQIGLCIFKFNSKCDNNEESDDNFFNWDYLCL